MNLTQHPEYKKYLEDKEFTAAIQAASTLWLAENETAGLALKTAVSQLIVLFQEYNKVMWIEHPFCQMCLGGCCVVGASEVAPIDAAALAILGYDLPVLPAQTHHNDRACIYLGERGCTWPANWRPLKCMTFFSLGSGDWNLESSDGRYGHLEESLQAILDEYLPDILTSMLEIDTNDLVDPIQFAPLLSRQLTKQFLPFEMSGAHSRSEIPIIDATAIALLAISSLIEKIMANPPANIDQLLTDVEQFEWVITSHPAQEDNILAEINGRYNTLNTLPLSLQFSQDIQQYRQSINKNMEIS